MTQRSEVDPRFKLKSVIFEVTRRCNLDCQYCYNIHKCPGKSAEAEESYRVTRKVLSRIFRCTGVRQVTMSGGDPFLAERFVELALYCRINGKKVTVLTNGNTATREEYRYLASIGVTSYQIPLHSFRAEEHDELTCRKGSFEKVLESIDEVRRLGAKVVPMIVLTRINISSLAGTLSFLSEKRLKRIMLNRFNIGGRGIERANGLSLSVEELRAAFGLADEAAAQLKLKLTSNVCSPVCALDPSNYPNIGFGSCSADVWSRSLVSDCAGNIRFCNHSPVVMGNILDQDLSEIFDTDYATSWKNTVPALCAECEKWSACFGGCRAASEQLGLPISREDPILWNK